ncbi:MAG: MFS transporter, partial [Actinomycetota bacterium]|nr:MFS transporter [Actinomycetota bacterium]
MTGPRYRWAVLAAGTAAQASFSTLTLGLPAIAPALRAEFGLDLHGIGLLFAAQWFGIAVALLPWGFVVDRVGERWALGAGLAGCGALLASIALTDAFLVAGLLLALAGAVGASVQSASGRAVMHWFRAEERGFAFGVRQTAVVLGGFIGAVALPLLVRVGDVDAAFVFLGGLCVVAASVGVVVVRDAPRTDVERG